MIDAADVAANAEAVRGRVRAAGGDPAAVRLIAVTKAFPVGVVRAALAAGLVDLGENYAQELLEKAAALAAPAPAVAPAWHFIGRLQSNKVKALAPHVALWHTVDRPSVVDAIARHAPGAAVLVQVNASGEDQKGGVAPAGCPELVERAGQAGLAVRGLMTVGVAGDADGTRAAFRAVRALADRLGLPECSMGMSGDLELAVAEGSTMVRIGRDLFGARG